MQLPSEEDLPASLLLAAYPSGARIVEIRSYRPGYLPYPARVTVETAEGIQAPCVLLVDEDTEKISRQAQVLQALDGMGLPVPRVLSGPVTVQREGRSQATLLVSEQRGEPLSWFGPQDLDEASRTCQLVGEAVDALHSVSARIAAHSVSRILPRVTLASELNALHARTGPWRDLPLFAEALALLEALVPTITTPLVFSNGDYNPVNFLHVGAELTGLVDFENACFEDPYIGFAKFFLWADDSGWWTGVKSGLVERYLYAHNVAPLDFLPRLVLRGLRHLQESHASAQNAYVAPEYQLNVIAAALKRLKS